MSDVEEPTPGAAPSDSGLGTTILEKLFGDYLGATLFLVALAWFGLYWEIAFLSNDEMTFANTLINLVDGHLYIDWTMYGPDSGATPGTYKSGGRVYGRNYAMVVVAAVWFLLLKTISLVADVRIVLVGLWSLSLVGIGAGVGTWLDRRREGVLLGTGLATMLFMLNLLVASPIERQWLPLIALQLTTAIAAALIAVILYRLASRLYSRRVGVFCGLTAAVGTPIGFWATAPKRHSVTALFVVGTMYTLYRSREASDTGPAMRYRALTYVWVGMATWLHAAEGLILLLAILAVDLPTARSNSPRHLLLVGASLFVSLIPFFVTNYLISGNLLEPPRLLTSFRGNEDLINGADQATPDGGSGSTGNSGGSEGGGTAGNAASSGSGGGGGGSGSSSGVEGSDIWNIQFAKPFIKLQEQFEKSFAAFTDLELLWQVFVRWGYDPTLPSSHDPSVNLSIAESMPILGTVLTVPVLVVRKLLSGIDVRGIKSPTAWSPVRVIDVFTCVYAILLLGVFLERLPVHFMRTVRYFHPLYAIGVYWLVRLPVVRRTVTTRWQSLSAASVGTVLLGVPLYLVNIDSGNLVLGESIQLYALVALAWSGVVAVWAVAGTALDRFERSGSLVLGVSIGLMATFLLVSGLALHPTTGEFLLPISRVVSEGIHYWKLYGLQPPSLPVT